MLNILFLTSKSLEGERRSIQKSLKIIGEATVLEFFRDFEAFLSTSSLPCMLLLGQN